MENGLGKIADVLRIMFANTVSRFSRCKVQTYCQGYNNTHEIKKPLTDLVSKKTMDGMDNKQRKNLAKLQIGQGRK